MILKIQHFNFQYLVFNFIKCTINLLINYGASIQEKTTRLKLNQPTKTKKEEEEHPYPSQVANNVMSSLKATNQKKNPVP